MTSDVTVPAQEHRPVVVLVGPPGAGKSTVGRAVAEALGVDFVDTDAMVETAAGMPVADIFLLEGEPAFRDREAQATREALTTEGVVAVGGGTVVREENRAALHGHRVVLLEVGIADAAKRVGLDRSRPLLGINPRGQWMRLLEARRAFYEEVATARVDTAGRPVEDVVADVLAIVRSA